MKIADGHNESKLVKLCKKKDAKAQYKLYKLYSKAMYNVAIRMTNDRGLAEDVIQDAFIKAFSEIDKLQNENAFGGWLKRIVTNRCIDEMRKRKIVFTNLDLISEKHLETEVEIDDWIDPELVHQSIKKLPNGAREVLVMFALEGYKHAEIAEKLGISESTTKTQYYRAKLLLGKMIKKLNHETRTGKIFENESLEARL